MPRDALGREDGNEEFERLQQFLSAASTSGGSVDANVGSDQMSLPDRVHTYFRTGHTAFEAKDPEAFRHYMSGLNAKPEDWTGWISKLALCQGLLATSASDEAIRADFMALADFLSSTQGFARAQSPTEPIDPAAKNGLKLDDVVSYAADAGLRRLVMTPPPDARHGLSIDLRTSQNSAASVVATVDAKGRRRVEVPFRMFGHVVFTEPERTTGLLWCYDLLKAGYLFAHIPTPLGARRALVPALIARNVLDRFCWHWGIPNPGKQWITALSRMARPRKPTFQPYPGVVLMVTDSLGRGGSERQMVALSYGLLRRGYQVQVLSLTRLEPGAPSFQEDLSRLGITPTYAADSPPDRLTSMSATLSNLEPADYAALPKPLANRILAIASTIERGRAEVVHAWLDGPGIAGALAACITGAPRIIIQQGSMSVARRRVGSTDLLQYGYRALARNPAVTILNNSQAGARDNERWIGLRTGSIGVLYNGFVPNSARAADPETVGRLRQSLGLPAHAQVVGTVMRFVPDKDPVLWIDTAAEIANARPDAHFLIAGFGPMEDMIKARIDALGLRDRIVLAGPVDDAGLIYCATDVVLLTSAIEGIPNVMIEAQAVGRPVVALDVGGTREAVAEGRTGTIVRPRTAEALASATISLLDNVAWRERVRNEGPEFVARRFGLDRMLGETIAFYGFGSERQGAGSVSAR